MGVEDAQLLRSTAEGLRARQREPCSNFGLHSLFACFCRAFGFLAELLNLIDPKLAFANCTLSLAAFIECAIEGVGCILAARFEYFRGLLLMAIAKRDDMAEAGRSREQSVCEVAPAVQQFPTAVAQPRLIEAENIEKGPPVVGPEKGHETVVAQRSVVAGVNERCVAALQSRERECATVGSNHGRRKTHHSVFMEKIVA